MDPREPLVVWEAPKSYKEWKKFRKELVAYYANKLLAVSEAEIAKIFWNWLQYARNKPELETQHDSIRRITAISLISYFERDLDTLRPVHPYLMTCLISGTRLRVQAASKTLKYIADECTDGASLFARPIRNAHHWLQEEGNAEAALYIIHRARFVDPDKVITIGCSFFEVLCVWAFKDDRETRKAACSLLEFVVERADIKLAKELANILLTKSMENIEEGIYVLKVLSKARIELFTQAKVDTIVKTCIEIRESPRHRSICRVLVMILEKQRNVYKTDRETIMKILIDNDYPRLVSRAVDCFENSYNPKCVLDYITRRAEHWTCNDSYTCPFEILSKLLDHFPDMEVPPQFNTCDHFIECLKKHHAIMPAEKQEYYRNISNMSALSSEEIRYVLLVQRTLFDMWNFRIDDLGISSEVFFSDVSLRKEILTNAGHHDSKEVQEILLSTALYDEAKTMRVLAVRLLKPTVELAFSMKIRCLLNDPCAKVKRKAIGLLAKLNEYNPLEIGPYVLTCLNSFSEATGSLYKKTAQKVASVVPPVCKYFAGALESYIDRLVHFVIALVNEKDATTEPIVNMMASINETTPGSAKFGMSLHEAASTASSSSVSSKDETSSFTDSYTDRHAELSSGTDVSSQDVQSTGISGNRYATVSAIENVPQRDHVTINNQKLKSDEPRKSKIRNIISESVLNKRDASMCKALSHLGMKVEPYLSQILDMFAHLLSTRKDTEMIISLVSSLRRLSRRMYNGLNIRLYCPQLIVPLTRLLETSQSDRLSIEITKLLGTAFDSIDTGLLARKFEHPKLGERTTTEFIMDNIFSCFPTMSLPHFAAITMIIVSDIEKAACYISRVTLVFMQMVKRVPNCRETVLSYMEILLSKAPREFDSIIPIITADLLKLFDDAPVVRFFRAMSFYAPTVFLPIASSVYSTAISKLITANEQYFSEVVEFITFAIIFQNQPVESFLYTIEKMRNEKYMQIVADALTLVVQNADMRSERTRLYQFTHLYPDTQLLFSLVLFADLPPSLLARRVLVVDDSEIGNVEESTKPVIKRSVYEILCNTERNQNELTFLQFRKPKLSLKSLPFVAIAPGGRDYFSKFTYPSEVYSAKLMNKMFETCIKRSPISAVRVCASIMGYSDKFNTIISVTGFCTCWKATTDSDRDHFSAIIQRILEEHRVIDDMIFEVIQLADRVNKPMKIDYVLAANQSKSHQFALYCLEKHLKDHPNDKRAIDSLMTVFYKLNRNISLRGLYTDKRLLMDELMDAKWRVNLGDWAGAMKIYEKGNTDFARIVECHYELDDLDWIYSMKDKYWAMTPEERDAVSESFLVSFASRNEEDSVTRIISSFEGNWTPYRFLLTINWYLSRGDYEHAQEVINRGFHFIATDKSIISTGDENEIVQHLNSSQLFVHCQETVNYRKEKSQRDAMWKQRIKGFKRDAKMWEQIISIKSKAIPVSENVMAYMKIISALRKDHQYEMIDKHFGYYTRGGINGSSILAAIKIIWAKGEKVQAYNICRDIEQNLIINYSLEPLTEGYPFRFIMHIYNHRNSIPDLHRFMVQATGKESHEEILASVFSMSKPSQYKVWRDIVKAFPEQTRGIVRSAVSELRTDKKFLARLHRLGATYGIQVSSSVEDAIDCQRLSRMSVKYDPNDYRCWRIWGYANTRLYALSGHVDDPNDSKRDDFLHIVKSKRRRKTDYVHDESIDLPELTTRRGSQDISVRAKNNIISSSDTSESDASQIDSYVVNIITGFLQAVNLHQKDGLEYLCQLFTTLFTVKDSRFIPECLIEEIMALPSSVLATVIPQITAQIDHEDLRIRDTVHRLCMKIGKDHFQYVFFPLFLYSELKHDPKEKVAKELLQKLKEINAKHFSDIMIFTDAMVRSAITWFEMWYRACEEAKLLIHEGKNNSATKRIQSLIEESKYPKCELDTFFLSLYTNDISALETELNAKSNITDHLTEFSAKLKSEIDKFNEIAISKVSEQFTKQSLDIEAPGMNFRIRSIEPTMSILDTPQKPRVLRTKTTNGDTIQYLLKCNEDVRIDERFMQFFSLANVAFMSEHFSRDQSILITRYAVIPLTVSAGLVQWLDGADTLHKIVCNSRQDRDIPLDLENTIAESHADCNSQSLAALQRYELFGEVCRVSKCDEVFYWLWVCSPNAQSWMPRQQNYAVTLATMSMVGYVIGLGDRHPNNMMIQRETGSVVHIDFTESFESAMLRPDFPERVPFRLTRTLMNNLPGSSHNGLFREIMCHTASALRLNSAVLVSQLAIFLDDPLSGHRDDEVKLDRSAEKIKGLEFSESIDPIPVEDQVDALISEAANPLNYVRHHPEWRPFW